MKKRRTKLSLRAKRAQDNTTYLLSTEANRDRLTRSIAQLTVSPDFLAYLDRATEHAEQGATIRFDNEADALAFIKSAPVAPYNLKLADDTCTNQADIDSPFVQALLNSDATIFDDHQP